MKPLKLFRLRLLVLAVASVSPFAHADKKHYDAPEFNTPDYWYKSGQQALKEAKKLQAGVPERFRQILHDRPAGHGLRGFQPILPLKKRMPTR